MSRLVAALVVLVWSASAAADRTPFKETLTRNELDPVVRWFQPVEIEVVAS